METMHEASANTLLFFQINIIIIHKKNFEDRSITSGQKMHSCFEKEKE